MVDRSSVSFDEAKVDAIFAELNQCHLPGGAIGISIGGRPVYRKGFGLARMELPVVLSPSTRMRIGSVTKHFTCLAYLLLCEERKAGIDDPVGKHLPELHPVTHGVTMRQLMNNTGGLREPYDVCFQFSGLSPHATDADLLALYRDMDDVNAVPGTAWIYNNGGWLILTAAIERITGRSLEEVLWERIFVPVGMYDTLLRRRDTDFVPNCATPHMVNAAGAFEKWYWMEYSGAGGMVSTVDDMLRWMAHMDSPRVGSAATWAAMKAPPRLPNGSSTDYGFALTTGRYRGAQTLWHAGSWLGGNAQMLKVPAAGLDVVMIVNQHGAWTPIFVNKVLDACLSGLEPVKPAVARPVVVSGTFRSPTTHRVLQLFGQDGQQFASIGGLDVPFDPDDAGVYRVTGMMSHLKQGFTLVGSPESPAALRFDDFGNVDEMVRVRPVERVDTGAITGRYRSTSTGSELTIFAEGDRARMNAAGRFGSVQYDLRCLGEGVWRAGSRDLVIPPGGILVFDSDGQTLRYSTSQTWALPFRRVA